MKYNVRLIIHRRRMLGSTHQKFHRSKFSVTEAKIYSNLWISIRNAMFLVLFLYRIKPRVIYLSENSFHLHGRITSAQTRPFRSGILGNDLYHRYFILIKPYSFVMLE